MSYGPNDKVMTPREELCRLASDATWTLVGTAFGYALLGLRWSRNSNAAQRGGSAESLKDNE